MTDQLLLIRDLIHERTGLFFADGRVIESLESRVSLLLEKSGRVSLSEYYSLLDNKPDSPEWLELISALSKPVSNFLRHVERINVLAGTVLPRLSGKGPIKIWSAGCATGEEPLSIVMALSDARWFDRAEIEIHASDANFTAIEKARAGLYSEPNVRYLSSKLQDKYFVPVNDGWQVRPEIHERIQWSVTNLINENEIAELAASNIIFCRNVFIYFSDPAISQTLRLLGKLMPAGGYLFTDEGDHFTSLVNGVGIFEEEKVNGISIWRKMK